MTITANCKVNLTMEVLGKRDDGYHNIYSFMQFLELGDTLEVTPADEFSFWCDDPELNNEQNLAVRAYRRLEQSYLVQPVAIRLYKKVPCMSGMGGGSADAAAVMHAVNELSGLNLPLGELMVLGKQLGADIPACLVGGTLVARGIGELISPIVDAKPLWYCIIKPKVAFSTPEMYARMDSAESFAPQRDQQGLFEALLAGDPVGIAPWLTNSFEQVAQPLTAITEAKQLLIDSGAVAASMTGAGSAVFGIYHDEQAATAAYHHLLATGAEVYLTRGSE